MREVKHLCEAALAHLFFGLFRLLPVDIASAIGGFIGRNIGPFFPVTRVAKQNLILALPGLNEEERTKIIKQMWDNLGRVFAEFPHLPQLSGKTFEARVELEGIEHLERAINQGKGIIIFSGHFGNWEVMPRTAAELGQPLMLVYRRPNNPYVDALIQRSRSNSHAGLHGKGRESAKHLIRGLKEGKSIGMLVDQKMNDGIAVPFFGRDAMTAPAMAELAIKFGSPIIPAIVTRKNGFNFKVKVLPPLSIEHKKTAEIMREVNELLEQWVRAYPHQWFWVHRRWPKH